MEGSLCDRDEGADGAVNERELRNGRVHAGAVVLLQHSELSCLLAHTHPGHGTTARVEAVLSEHPEDILLSLKQQADNRCRIYCSSADPRW